VRRLGIDPDEEPTAERGSEEDKWTPALKAALRTLREKAPGLYDDFVLRHGLNEGKLRGQAKDHVHPKALELLAEVRQILADLKK
jgi:hypothetical protein